MISKTLIQRRELLGATGVLDRPDRGRKPAGAAGAQPRMGRGSQSPVGAEGSALMAVTRTIAPHDKLDAAAYALVVQSIDSDAAKDPQLLGILQDGIRHWVGLPVSRRVRAGAGITGHRNHAVLPDPRVKTLGTLYATPIAYAISAMRVRRSPKGATCCGGFNDLRWLPEVPPPDSGPVPGR